MQKLPYALFLAFLMLGCNSPQKAVLNSPEATVEFRQLDTMVVSAGRDADPERNYELPVYRASPTRTNDLLHTSLALRFDWEAEEVIGQASLSLTPYFYAVEEVVLDAKGFQFSKVSLAGAEEELKYEYDGEQITIFLGQAYERGETYGLDIHYTAKPKGGGGSSAITSDQGLFFINPRGEEIDKPKQIWTQGETENNSRWFPTIDKPNERCTQEVMVTVESQYEVLSNGTLVSTTANEDGTKTWHWKLDQPHAPYLFMLAIGEFAVVTDNWEGKPVTYYVEPAYKADAEYIFAHTKEMLSFFSDKLGVKYPWPKYAQVVVRDFVSGAMENTTAVIFGDFVQRHRRELIDNHNDGIVAHELAHHWFGDLVTTESWANLTMNEGFANYSEYLWFEHKYGRDNADYHLLGEWAGYLSTSQGDLHPLIHFGYEDKEDMFDAHSYNKGGAVLHMLRAHVGDEAFWASLNRYLTDNAYTAVEAHNLRLAFEAVTGEDLNWFFNQWYFDQGHPQLEVEYSYDEAAGMASVVVEQVQSSDLMPAIFQLPVAIDLYLPDGQVLRKDVWVKQRKQRFDFEVPAAPVLANFDAERMLLAEVNYRKTEEALRHQFYNAPKFLDRYEALMMTQPGSSEAADQLIADALADPFWSIRSLALSKLNDEQASGNLEALYAMAQQDPHSSVRAEVFDRLAALEEEGAETIARTAIAQDSAYNVIGSALQYLAVVAPEAALQMARELEKEPVGELLEAIGVLYAETGDAAYLPFFRDNMRKINGFAAMYFMESYQALALESSLADAKQAGQDLNELALDRTASPWLRFGAARAINQMRLAFEAQAGEAEQALAAELLELLKGIKKNEESEQLRSFYDQMLPDMD